jgi:hypothetical protein
MSRHLRGLSAVGILTLLLAATAWAQEDMVANPYYKFWAGSKPGATAVHLEQTKLSGAEGKLVPDGVDEKRIAYQLVKLDKDRAVVEMVVTEQDFLGYIQAAPTRYIYPAKIKKSHLERILLEPGAKKGKETLKVAGKEIKCRTVAGTLKKGPGGEQVEFKLWLSDDVPGSIVKQVRKTRQKDDVIAETTITLQSYSKSGKLPKRGNKKGSRQ